MLSEEVKSWGLSSSQAKRGPGSRSRGPKASQKPGVSGDGKEGSYSTLNKKGTARVGGLQGG